MKRSSNSSSNDSACLVRTLRLSVMGNSQEPQDFNISVMPSSLTPVHVAKAAEGLNLYDTASHQVSHFVPLKPGEVGIYVCVATVQ